MDACSHFSHSFVGLVRDENTAYINDIMEKKRVIARAAILGLLADEDPRSPTGPPGKHNVFLISSRDVCIRHSATRRTDLLPDDAVRCGAARRRNNGGNCTEKTEVSRCERKSTMARRRCLDVLCKERGNGRPPLFGHTKMRIMRWKRS